MLQITADPSFMSKSQREAVAAFILSYPSSSTEDLYEDDPPADIQGLAAQDEDEAAAVFGAASPLQESEDEDTDAAEAAAVFGALPARIQDQITAVVPNPAAGPVLVPNPPPVAAIAENDRLDKSGLPWDERIHASSRAKNADSTWRKKRGIDDGTVALVEAELKALMALPGAAQPAAIPAPPATVATIPAPPVPAAVAEDRQAYVTLLSVASAAINAKTLTAEQLAEAVTAAGVPSLPLLGNRLDLVPQVMAAVKAIIG
jgi:hypothetical protein